MMRQLESYITQFHADLVGRTRDFAHANCGSGIASDLIGPDGPVQRSSRGTVKL